MIVGGAAGTGQLAMTVERLSALDASFLAVERPEAPMHVGWVAQFEPPAEGPRPGYGELLDYVAGRLGRAPRYRQRLADVPFGLHDPVWVDDPGFDVGAHLPEARGDDLDELVDAALSTPLERDRPLWEIAIAAGLPGDRIALIGKMHHCMVDGTAVVELGNLLLDAKPEAWTGADPEPGWDAVPGPSARALVAQAARERAGDAAALVLAPARLATSPRRLAGLPGAARRGARTFAHTVLPPAPRSPLNQPGSARRHHVRVTRELDQIRAVRRHFGVTPNDVILAACAGALRRYALRRGERPQALKAMVPADVRTSDDAAATGNRISFVFVELPCDEPDPVLRLDAVNRTTAQRARDDEAAELDVAFRALARTPAPLQRAFAQAFAHPRLWNLTVSSVPGPAVPRYLRGCRLREVHSAIPLTGRHALSIGIVTVAGSACFGVIADADALPDADLLAADLDAALDELVAAGS
jgi:WS/DGAT/MGAT family acyltransferase